MMECLLCAFLSIGAEVNEPWHVFYEDGFPSGQVAAWASPLTSSQKTAEGLQITDPSTENGSGRLYSAEWHVDPKAGATVETRLKVKSCSSDWGVVLLVADGVHEEGVTFFPDRVVLAKAGIRKDLDTRTDFRTYRVRIAGTDIHVWADDTLLLDGTGKFTAPAHANRNQIAFGCGSSTATGEAVWQFVRFRGGKIESPRLAKPEVPGLDIGYGPTRVIVPDAIYVSLFKFADGRIAVDGKRSADSGDTWQQGPAFHTGAYQFPDGEIIQLGFHTKATEREGFFTTSLIRSTDQGKTTQADTAVLHIPEAAGGTGDDGKPYEGPLVDHAIVGLRDGSLLAAMYGQFKTDRVPVPTMPAEWQCFKYRTFVVRSADRGKTWQHLSTVAYDPKIGLESFCEADLLRTPGGDVLCFMRTGGSGGKHTPLYLSRSSDDGRTWGKPQPIADRGVWPNACLMQSGILACTYGRPGNWLMFSLDEGHTWTAPHCFYSGPTTSYNSVEEVAPGRLLVVYDRQQLDDGGNLRRETVGTTVTVDRTPANK